MTIEQFKNNWQPQLDMHARFSFNLDLKELKQQIRADAINELVDLVIECGMSMGWVDADSFIELAEKIKESKEWMIRNF